VIGQTLEVKPSITLRLRHAFYMRLKANRHDAAQKGHDTPETLSHAPTI
jgi:hypothetical protein